ncbi:MAG: Gfo/Idh/MocA family oxidoreductase [Kiritimatiellae bacterium]|nr:Gfo/Idh/MocA family oxidoreductase [Kiritimatiellia bacterium]
MSKKTRRQFLKASTGAGLGLTVLPAYLTSARAADNPKRPPSQRINLGCVGTGNRASVDINQLCGEQSTVVALCDVDFVGKMRGQQGILNRFPDAPRYDDFRVMMEKSGDDIDAVVVATPDHTHFVATILAMSMGKHVYVEKPLTHTYAEADMLMLAEKKYGVVTQMGNQGHSTTGFTQFQHLVDAGVVRDIVKMDAFKSPGEWFMNAGKRFQGAPPEAPVPEGLNWDLWCGPRAKRPYCGLYHPFNWRGFHEYGGGMLGDWGAHIIDFVHDGLKLGLPTKISPIEMTDHNRVAFPLNTQLSMHFPARGEGMPALDMTWRDGQNCRPDVPEQYWDKDGNGTPVAPKLGGAGTVIYRADEKFAMTRGSHSGASRIIPRDQFEANYETLKAAPQGTDHHRSFIQACLGNGKTRSPFSVSGDLTKVLVLGTICQYLNAELTFDPVKQRFVGNEEANAMLNPPARAGWESFYKMV